MNSKFFVLFLLFFAAVSFCLGASKSVYFDGAGDYINLGSNQTQDGMDGATGLTLETWLNASSLRTGSARNVVADFCLNASFSMVMMYFTDNGKFRFGGRSVSTDSFQDILTTSAIITTGTWYHMAGVLDFTNKTIKIYQNGILIGSRTGVSFGSNTFTSTSGSNEYIGANQTLAPTQFFHGYLDEIRIWNTPRTQDQIVEDMTVTISPQSGLLGYWPLDDSAEDMSGNNYDGTLTGNAAYSSSGFHFGKYYRSLDSANWRNVSNWEVSEDNSTWQSASVYPGPGTTTYIRSGDGVTLAADAQCENLFMEGGTLTTGSYAMSVNGTFTYNSGTVSGGVNINGYQSAFLDIAESSDMISGFSVSTSLADNLPERIDREWSIAGTCSGNKALTFYWDGDDDGNHTWGSQVPSVYKGTTEYTQSSYNVATDPRWVTASIPSFDAKATFQVGRNNDETLPIELSSFTATLSISNQVAIQWITQSETNVSGFRLYRNMTNDIQNSTMLNLFVPATNTSQMQAYMVKDDEVTEEGTYYYWLEDIGMNGGSHFHGPVTVTVTFSQPSAPEIPLTQGIVNAYPNPFNPTLHVSCAVKESGLVNVKVFNTRGQLVKTLMQNKKQSGFFDLTWDGTDNNGKTMSSGIYLIIMQGETGNSSRKVVLTK